MTRLENYTEKYYESMMIQFTNKLQEKIDSNLEVIISEFQKTFKNYIDNLAKNQDEETAFVHISFLYTSLSEKIAKLRLEAFPIDGVLFGESLYTDTIEIPFLVDIITQTKNELLKLAEQDNESPFIHNAFIDQLLIRMISASIRYLFEFYKYHYADLFDIDAIFKLNTADDFFITFGDYYDWQKPIFANRAEVDLFNRAEDEDLNFRKYNNFIFKDKKFDDLKISNSVFKGCRFENSELLSTSFADCIFEDCIFRKTVLTNVNFIGNTFEDCVFENIQFENAKFHIQPSITMDNLQLFKLMEFISCELNICTFNDCELTNAKLIDSVAEQIFVTNSITIDSDFSVYENMEEM